MPADPASKERPMNDPRPPPLPGYVARPDDGNFGRDPTGSPDDMRGGGLFQRVSADYGPVAGPLTATGMAECILKRPGAVAFELTEGRAGRSAGLLALLTLGCLAIYGLLVGMFSGGHQLWAASMKVALGAMAGAMICAPSLHVMACISGSSVSAGQTARLILQSLALAAVLLVAFAPVAWLFTESTESIGFMSVLHLLLWGTVAVIGIRLLGATLHRAGGRKVAFLGVWGVTFFVVTLQMCTTLRPLVGPYDGLFHPGRKSFIEHWGNVARAPHTLPASRRVTP